MKPTLKLLAILVITTLVLLGYAMIREPDSLGGWKPRQISLRALQDDATSHAPKKKRKPDMKNKHVVAKKDTACQHILFFGDSMTAPLSFRMKDYATENGHTLTTVCWYSSTCGTWANTDTLAVFMAKVKPTHIFICLGSNQLFVHDLEKLEKDIIRIKEKCGDIPTIWIGPPNWKKDTGINDILLKVMGKEAYYPSLKLTFQRRKDGAHPTDKSAAKWFDAVAQWMNEGKSIHNIRMKNPSKRGKQRIYTLAPPKEE